ncbi:acylphosphatase [Bacillus sp. B1-b2]|uniref:acylphosphatase n=1 Tax=Bacillus sp. B1-b2 TaxID=2653201 RepID=UPI00126238B9|nr:acylphosphatase [Bacillus sp. B1-b2]KAB7672514.1 acylphosphatase [Bacillus sp. B1-b2]
MIQYHVLVSGKVQGVGFRYFVQMTAMQYEITGWVKNRSNGMVEIVAIGEQNVLDSFLVEIKRGNRFAKVQKMDITKEETSELFTSFRITY